MASPLEIRATNEFGGQVALDAPISDTFHRLFDDQQPLWVTIRILPGAFGQLVCARHTREPSPLFACLRRSEPIVPLAQVLAHGRSLARNLAYQNALAAHDARGAQLILHGTPPPEAERRNWAQAIAREIEHWDAYAIADVGFDPQDFALISEHTARAVGHRDGGTVTTAALGLKEALRATAAALGAPLCEVKVIVQGIGELGGRIARALAMENAELLLSDRDHRRLDQFIATLEPSARERTRVIAPYQVTTTAADIYCPCVPEIALGEAALAELQVRAICGGTRHQLFGKSLNEELRLANLLQRRGILWVPDWIAGAGGAIHAAMEVAHGQAFDVSKAHARARRLCGWVVDEVLGQAKRTDRAPLEIAVRLLEAAGGG